MGQTNLQILEQIAQLAESAKEFQSKLDGGVKSASTKVRNIMQEIKGLAQDVRVECQAQVVELKKK
jgi:hypothetical protein